MGWDLDEYRRDAELFCEEIHRDYYLQGAGHKPDLEVEAIYARHEGLFSREAVERIGETRASAAGEDERRLRYLHHFALDGHLGARTRSLEARLAELEASLEVDVGGETIPYRMAPVIQANEPDAERRAQIEAARNATLAEHLNPLHREGLEISHAACTGLGWPSYLDAYSDVRALDCWRRMHEAQETRRPGGDRGSRDQRLRHLGGHRHPGSRRDRPCRNGGGNGRRNGRRSSA